MKSSQSPKTSSPKNSPPASSSENSSPQSKPIWETLVIAASFLGVWIYFFAWLLAGRAKTHFPLWWQFLLAPCLVALFIVFRRRMARARNAVRESNEMKRPPF